MSKKAYFIAGIDTNIGKTIVSAILTEALEADYWKPIQSGDLTNSDSDKLQALISNSKTTIHPNAYALQEAASPHYSAALENIHIDLASIHLPKTENHLIVEGAGGLLVPLNDKDLLIDCIQNLGIEVILVIKNYLGSINHSLLSIEALKARKIPVRGLIFNGPSNAAREDYILAYSGLAFLGRIREEKNFDKEKIKEYAKQFQFLAHD
ncbi:MAG: dethiobiotin synthase [Bacteroidetes bacterium]|nr:dethiobiotin synthase [Bacteroidota bacterium]